MLLPKKFKDSFNFLFRVLFVFLLFYFIFSKIDLKLFFSNFVNLSFLFILFLFSLYLISLWIRSIRWNYFLKKKDVSLGNWRLFKLYYAGSFFGSFLPTTFGGDIYKIFRLRTFGYKKIMYSVFFDRFFGFLVLFILGFYYLFYLFDIGLFVFILSLMILFTIYFNRFNLIRVFRFIEKTKFRKHYNYLLSASKHSLSIPILTSLIFVLLGNFYIYLVARTMGMDIGFLLLLTIYCISQLTGLFPLSIGGLGSQQGVLVYLLSREGVPIEISLAVSLTVYISVLFFNSLGALFYLIEKN